MSFQKILDKYRKFSFTEKDKGSRFERLMQAYLKTDPKYSYKFKHVWLWTEFPGKDDLGGTEMGIDLVALTHEGDYWAIQCKCYQETTVIDKKSVDTFLSTSSRTFKNEQMQTTGFAVRLWISTTNKWGPNATESLKNQEPPVIRINLYDLQAAPVDWDKLEQGIHGEKSRITDRQLHPHQKEALEAAHEYYKTNDRGKLIMACGTGKTFNVLRIAEKETNNKGTILYLVPSIALLGQILREWTTYALEPINPICICSDPEVSIKKSKIEDSDSFSIIDLAMPASTDVNDIIRQFRYYRRNGQKGMTVVFSTYQSIEVISATQKKLHNELPEIEEFDLIICDEAHRTTGVTLKGDDESAFVKVHDNNFIKAKRRLYMTATPRLYSDDVKSKAAQAEAELCSMDDKEHYGEEIYRIGFGDAVDKDLLSDYKVLILTLSDNDVPPAIQKMIADKESEINTDDASKLIGCINALSKQVLGDEGIIKASDPEPMRRAVGFCQNIAVSKKITATFNTATSAYISSLPEEKKSSMVLLDSRHIDGTMSAPHRDELLGWLKSDVGENECRILTNVKCLSEGVDVPSLDAVLFLSARNSQVDVVQSVGRVMRKSPGKKYGYIIIPVVVPSNVDAAKALDDNERYKVVWTVLNALRAHDDRFNATVNKIELNKSKPLNILVGRPEYSFGENGNPIGWQEDSVLYETSKDISKQLALQFEQLQNVVFARMVLKVGDKQYWEQWAKNVAEIAERQVVRMNRLIKDEGKHQKAFEKFLSGLRKNINPSISEQEAIEMLSQHVITKPVFEALFEGYSFVKQNSISVSMQRMLDLLEEQAIEKDTETLNKFYESVKMRAAGIDNAEGKQRIIIELYDKFFKSAFPKMVERLGIVYTPVELVDFIIHSVNEVLKKEFNRCLSDENIHILDPFTGTGTFITRLLQSGLIEEKDIRRKYAQELHANEIVLLAYYIAAVNIENAFHDVMKNSEFLPFDGICLTDTFQLGETDDGEKLFSEMFPQNSKRVQRQQKAPLKIILGNPPYSIAQNSSNDNAQNQSYQKLDKRILESYSELSSASLNRSLYDPYIKAFRWSTDRLDKTGGIVCFVSNGGWLEGNSTDGFRKCLEREFSTIYVFNLRGNQRTSGELSRKEGGKIFGSGSRTPISITLLVKNPDNKTDKAIIYYHEVEDYLSREEKLAIVKNFNSVGNPQMKWETLKPNEHGDWLRMRNDAFDNFIPLAPEKNFNLKSQSFFIFQNPGLLSARESWVYNYSKENLVHNMSSMVSFYEEQRAKIDYENISDSTNFDKLYDTNPNKISWSRALKNDLKRNISHKYDESNLCKAVLRPFFKQHLYYDKNFIESPSQFAKLISEGIKSNIFICLSGIGASKENGIFISNSLVDYNTLDAGAKCFPLYYYEENNSVQKGLFDTDDNIKFIRRDVISNFILERAQNQYGKNVTKEDIFYYVYSFLHSKEYRESFANDLNKMLPRIPLVEEVKDFWAFSNAGRKLADLHLNYESLAPFPDVKVIGDDTGFYKVEKMRFPKKGQTDTIIYNSHITLTNIPSKAYEYVVNGKSAIDWVIERYQVTVNKDSGIKNDPNDWAKEVSNPRYILDLLLSVINVSVQTVDIVNGLPKSEF